MRQLELPEEVEYSVRSRYRFYVIFTAQKIPVWTPLVKLGIAQYQKSPVKYTHTLLAVQDMFTERVVFYEMTIWNGMDTYECDYSQVQYNARSLELLVMQENHYGCIEGHVYHAIDVTTRIKEDVEGLWYRCLTDKRLTPFTLLNHITGQPPVTWTCSGLTSALIGMPRDVCYLQPMSPDQLHDYLVESDNI